MGTRRTSSFGLGDRLVEAIVVSIVVAVEVARFLVTNHRIGRMNTTEIKAAHPAAWSVGEDMARQGMQKWPSGVTFYGWTDRQKRVFIREAGMAALGSLKPDDVTLGEPVTYESLKALSRAQETTLSEAFERKR